MAEIILFDLDGTISDPKVGICTSVQHALHKMGIEVDDIEKLTPFIGPPLRDSFSEYYNIKSEDMEKCIGFYRERFSTVGLYENDLYEGMEDLLRSLYEAGKKLVLCSSKPRVFVEKILKHFNIYDYFSVVMGSELDGSRESKTDVMLECIRLLSDGKPVDTSKCIMVGDRKFDVEAANKLGLISVAVAYGYGPMEELIASKPDRIVADVSSLKTFLME